MKRKFSLLCVLLICLSGLVGCAEQPEQPSAGINWRVETTGKYLYDDSVSQLITVQAVSQNEARVKLFEKSTENGKTIWTETLSCPGYIGKAGLGKTKEGDSKTPIGDFGIVTAFGIRENPGTVLPYVDVTDDIYCCCDPDYYNQIIDIREHPHDCSEGEHMIDYSPEYNYGFFLDYNSEGTVGRGTAIFFHCSGANAYTGGCIAVSEENMVTILKALDPNARVIIDYLR